MYTTIPKHFPDAILMSDFQEKILSNFKAMDISPDDTIWATSICSDELNNFLQDLNSIFAGPGPFRLGGISGLPFVGVTGFNAFLSHAPAHGCAMIIYGPHVGVSEHGILGEVNRQNQFGLTTCCGSLVGALGAVEQNQELPIDNPLDYQQARVIKHLIQYREEILKDKFPLKKATDFAYIDIHEKLKRIINVLSPELTDIKLYLIGGIVINTDWKMEDFFEIRDVELLEF
ncbi:MAG: hypothetical protein RLN90_04675 [Balneolaceae bacterium]